MADPLEALRRPGLFSAITESKFLEPPGVLQPVLGILPWLG
jgi:hypothetical protein